MRQSEQKSAVITRFYLCPKLPKTHLGGERVPSAAAAAASASPARASDGIDNVALGRVSSDSSRNQDRHKYRVVGQHHPLP